MEWNIHIDPNVNCAFVFPYGPFDIGDVIKTVSDVVHHPQHRSDMHILHDYRDYFIPSDLSFKAISEASYNSMQKHYSKLGKCKVAAVVDDAQSYAKAHQYFLSGRFEKYPVERKAFRDMEKALEWLGLPPGYKIKNPEPC